MMVERSHVIGAVRVLLNLCRRVVLEAWMIEQVRGLGWGW